jgi:hypothetical protein
MTTKKTAWIETRQTDFIYLSELSGGVFSDNACFENLLVSPCPREKYFWFGGRHLVLPPSIDVWASTFMAVKVQRVTDIVRIKG